MKHILFTLLIGLGVAAHAAPETRHNAAFIVDAHFRSNDTDAKLAELAQQAVAALEPAIANFGAEIINPDRFAEALMGDFHVIFMEEVRNDTVAVYEKILTPQEIADLAAFYRSPEGKLFLAQELRQDTLKESIAFLKNGPGAPLLEHWPELWPNQERLLHQAETHLSKRFTLERIADILEMEDVVAFEDESRRAIVAKALRQAN